MPADHERRSCGVEGGERLIVIERAGYRRDRLDGHPASGSYLGARSGSPRVTDDPQGGGHPTRCHGVYSDAQSKTGQTEGYCIMIIGGVGRSLAIAIKGQRRPMGARAPLVRPTGSAST